MATGTALTACSGPGSGNASHSGAAPNGSEIHYALSSAVASLDPNSGALSGYGNAVVQGVRQSTLLEYKLTPSSCAATLTDADLEPGWIVSQWSISPDKKTIRFTLKSGIKSQSGHPLSSADVQYSIQRMLAIDPTGAYIFGKLGGLSKSNPITVIDKLNFSLNVQNPSQATAPVLSLYWLQIHDSADLKAHATAADPWAKTYLSTHVSDFGPWALESFAPSQSVSYVRNPNYSGPIGNIKKATFSTIADSSQRTQLIASGQAQISMALPPQDLKTLEGASAVTLPTCVSANRDYLGLNSSDPILSKTQVRRAISLAIDRGAISHAVYLDKFGRPANSGISSAFVPTVGKDSFKFDITAAKALLARAGYPDGFPMKITVSTDTPGPYANSLAIFLQSQLARIGVKVTIDTPASSAAFAAAAAQHKYQEYLWTESPTIANPGLAAQISAGCGSSQNYGGYCDPALDALAQKTLADEPGSAEYTTDANALSTMFDTNLPVIYLEDVSYTVPIAKCAASIPQSSQVKWAPLTTANIAC